MALFTPIGRQRLYELRELLVPSALCHRDHCDPSASLHPIWRHLACRGYFPNALSRLSGTLPLRINEEKNEDLQSPALTDRPDYPVLIAPPARMLVLNPHEFPTIRDETCEKALFVTQVLSPQLNW